MRGCLIVLFLSVGIYHSSPCQDAYYVSSPGGDSLCPEDVECNMLSYYLNNDFPSDCLVENVVLYFLEGTHNLSALFKLGNVTNITLQGLSQHNKETGESGAEITCDHGVRTGIRLSGADIHVANLSFTGCGSMDQPALYFKNVSGLYLSHITVQNSTFLGLIADSCLRVTITSSFFANNNYGHVAISYVCDNRCSCDDSNVAVTDSQFLTTSGTVYSFGGNGIAVTLSQGPSYFVTVVISNITVSNSWASNVAIVVSASSLHSILLDRVIVSGAGRGYVGNSSGISLLPRDDDSTSNSCRSSLQSVVTPVVISSCIFRDNAGQYGGGLLLDLRSAYSMDQKIMIDSCEFYHNRGELIGVAIAVLSCGPEIVLSNTIISYNTRSLASIISNTTCTFAAIGCTLLLEDVVIANNSCCGLATYNSLVKFKGKGNMFLNNTGYDGGGLALWVGSRMFLYPNTTVHFESNHANNRGGGVYWDEFLQNVFAKGCWNYIANAEGNTAGKELLFLNNTAGHGVGNDVYGLVNVQDCMNVVDIRGIRKSIIFASASVGICLCNSGNISCTNNTNLHKHLTAFPGEAIPISAALHGWPYQIGNNTIYPTVDGIVDVHVENSGGCRCKQLIELGTGCGMLPYTVESPSVPANITVTMDVHSDLAQFYSEDFSTVTLQIEVKVCPIGFELSHICICSKSVTMVPDANVTCNITDQSFQRRGSYWIGVEPNTNCIINSPCAALYCNEDRNTFTLNSNSTDSQCNRGRTGLLCGSCMDGWSLKLGTQSCCKWCSNWYLLLLIPFAVAGIALLVFINITGFIVSQGTVNGVILYANVVKLFEPIIFPNGPVPVLKIFIAWMNLDLGIDTCFYYGMTAAARAWLQFVFPVLHMVHSIGCHTCLKAIHNYIEDNWH